MRFLKAYHLQNFYNLGLNDNCFLVLAHSPFFSKGHVQYQSSSHQIYSFKSSKRSVYPSCAFHSSPNSQNSSWFQPSRHVHQSLSLVPHSLPKSVSQLIRIPNNFDFICIIQELIYSCRTIV